MSASHRCCRCRCRGDGSLDRCITRNPVVKANAFKCFITLKGNRGEGEKKQSLRFTNGVLQLYGGAWRGRTRIRNSHRPAKRPDVPKRRRQQTSNVANVEIGEGIRTTSVPCVAAKIGSSLPQPNLQIDLRNVKCCGGNRARRISVLVNQIVCVDRR